MQLLPPVTIGNAIATPAVGEVANIGSAPRNLTLQATFTYGSGGTTTDAYVQTTLDGGLTWMDIANFHFTTSSATAVINLSAATPQTSQKTPGDGTLASNTAVDGVLGPRFRVKYKSSGTYAGGTTLRIDAQGVDISGNSS